MLFQSILASMKDFTMIRRIILPAIAGFLVLSGGFIQAQVQVSDSQKKSPTFNQRHQAGIRLGLWRNLGDDAVADNSEDGQLWKTDIGNNNFFFEIYGGYRINSLAMAELSFSFVNRGSVTNFDGYNSYVGNLIVYSVLLQLKAYPIPTLPGRFHPYLLAGGGLYYGRHDVQFTTEDYYYDYFNEKSGTDFSYVIGGGLDWPLADYLGVDLSVKYMPISLSKELVTMSEYSALSVSVGVKYLFNAGK